MNKEKAVRAANELISQEMNPLKGPEKGLSVDMAITGDKFNRLLLCFKGR